MGSGIKKWMARHSFQQHVNGGRMMEVITKNREDLGMREVGANSING
jgi:hypothetical protein